MNLDELQTINESVEIRKFAELQCLLVEMNDESYETIRSWIISSMFVWNQFLLSELIENILNTISIRPFSFDLFIKLTHDFIVKCPRTSIIAKFKLYLLNSIFRPIGDWKFVLKIPQFHFILACMKNNIVSIMEIASAIRRMLPCDGESPNLSALCFCFFGPYLEHNDNKPLAITQ